MKNLNNIEWGEFVFGKIFKIAATKSGIDKIAIVKRLGKIPYVTRSEKNNGIDLFIGQQESNYSVDQGNVITIGLDTQTVFYQPYYIYTGQNIQILYCEELNFYTAHFLIPLIKKQLAKFSWGSNGATLTRLKRSKILLPTTGQVPDFAFMEQFIREKEVRKRAFIGHFFFSKQDSLTVNIVIKPLADKEWKAFEIGRLFDLQQGKSKGLNHLVKSTHYNAVNYLGATNLNNGVICQVERNEKLIQPGNCIAFIRNGEGSMGYSIYKEEEFIATSDITVGYSNFLNRYVGLFITTVADKVRGKYNFGYKRSDQRLKKEKILLPTNELGEPDYNYMENYIMQLQLNKIKDYLNLHEHDNN